MGTMTGTTSATTGRRLALRRRFEPVTGATDGGYEGGLPAPIQLVAQVADVDVDYVGAGVERVIPDGGEDLLPTHDLPRVAHEVLEQGELAAREVHLLLPAPDPVREEVDLEIPHLYPRSLRLVGAAHEGPHPRHQLLEVEGLGQVVIGSAVQSPDLVAHLVAGGEHQDGKPRAARSDAPQHLLAVHPRQHDVQQDEVHRLVGGHDHAVVAVVHANGPVAVGRETALEEAGDTGVVFDDEDVHGAPKYNRDVLRNSAGSAGFLGRDAA